MKQHPIYEISPQTVASADRLILGDRIRCEYCGSPYVNTVLAISKVKVYYCTTCLLW